MLSSQRSVVIYDTLGLCKPPLPRVQRNLVDGSVPEDDFDQVSASQPQAGSRKASLGWFKQTQLPQIKEAQGQFAEWFHGIITRRYVV